MYTLNPHLQAIYDALVKTNLQVEIKSEDHISISKGGSSNIRITLTATEPDSYRISGGIFHYRHQVKYDTTLVNMMATASQNQYLLGGSPDMGQDEFGTWGIVQDYTIPDGASTAFIMGSIEFNAIYLIDRIADLIAMEIAIIDRITGEPNWEYINRHNLVNNQHLAINSISGIYAGIEVRPLQHVAVGTPLGYILPFQLFGTNADEVLEFDPKSTWSDRFISDIKLICPYLDIDIKPFISKVDDDADLSAMIVDPGDCSKSNYLLGVELIIGDDCYGPIEDFIVKIMTYLLYLDKIPADDLNRILRTARPKLAIVPDIPEPKQSDSKTKLPVYTPSTQSYS